MDNHSFKTLLCDGPRLDLLNMVDSGQDHTDFLPLIDAELQRSASRLQRLKEYRNSLSSSLYRLQPELLSKIFFIYAQDNNALFDLRWTRLLFVCRRWHDVAKQTQSLWSYIEIIPAHTRSIKPKGIDARDVRRIETQRSRAGLWPLTIQMILHGNLPEAKQAYISMFWDRLSLASLSVNGEFRLVNRIIRILAAHRHSVLKTIKIFNIPSLTGGPMGIHEPMNIALRDNLPQLQCLTIIGLPFDWTLIQGLHSLRVDYSANMALPSSLRNILDSLSRCPLLESFSLKLPPSFHFDTSTSPPEVTLPHLSLISLQGAVAVCADLLRPLRSIPSSAKVVVTSDARAVDHSMISTLATYIGGHVTREGGPIIYSVAIALMSSETEPSELPDLSMSQLAIVGQHYPTWHRDSRTRALAFSNLHEKPNTCISLTTAIPSVAADAILTNILLSWPLSRATHVDLRSVNLSLPLLTAIFAGLPAASAVIVLPESASVSALFEFLEARLNERGQRGVANILFDAAGVSHHRFPDIWDGTPRVIVEVLARRSVMRALQYCSKAARAGAPLDTIEIFNEPKVSRHRMMESVDGVDWSELYGDLQEGFVYEGVLYNTQTGSDGSRRDASVFPGHIVRPDA